MKEGAVSLAVWQFPCNIIPMREKFDKLSRDEMLTWKGIPQPTVEIGFLEKGNSWSPNIILYGNTEETCIEFFYDQDELEDIFCRLDLRTLTKKNLINIVKYVQDIGACFLVDDKVYQPELEVMIDVMKQSAANRYCKNPIEYLGSIGK